MEPFLFVEVASLASACAGVGLFACSLNELRKLMRKRTAQIMETTPLFEPGKCFRVDIDHLPKISPPIKMSNQPTRLGVDPSVSGSVQQFWKNEVKREKLLRREEKKLFPDWGVFRNESLFRKIMQESERINGMREEKFSK